MSASPVLWLLLCVLGGAGVLLTRRSPSIGFASLVLILLNVPNDPPVYPVLFAAAVGYALAFPANRGQQAFSRLTIVTILLIALVCCFDALAVMRGTDPVATSQVLIKIAQSYLLVAVFLAAYAKDGIHGLAYRLIPVVYLSLVLGIVQLAMGSFIFDADYSYSRRFLVLGIIDPNYTGLYLFLLLAIFLVAARNPLHDLPILITILAIVSTSVLTLSRTTYIVFGVVIVLRAFLGRSSLRNERHRSPSRWLSVLASVLVAVGMLTLSITTHYWGSVAADMMTRNALRLGGEVDTVSMRTEMWHHTWSALGPADLIIGRGDIDIPEWNRSVGGQGMTLHNLLLSVVVRYGLLGGLLFVLLLVAATVSGLRSASESRYFAALLAVGYGLFTLTLSDEIGLFVLLIVAAILLGAKQDGLPHAFEQPTTA